MGHRILAWWYGSDPPKPAPDAYVEGNQLHILGRSTGGLYAKERWLVVPLSHVLGLSREGEQSGRGDYSPRLFYRDTEGRQRWVLKGEIESGRHSFRWAIAAILEQQALERTHPERISGDEGLRYRRRIEMRARFAEGSNRPGFVDYDQG